MLSDSALTSFVRFPPRSHVSRCSLLHLCMLARRLLPLARIPLRSFSSIPPVGMPPRKRSSPASSSASPPPSKPSPAKKAKIAGSKVKKVEVETAEGADVLGEGIWKDWPAPRDQLELAKSFILEACVPFLFSTCCLMVWTEQAAPDSVKEKHRILLCPDKDTDGLSSCLVLYRTLTEHLSHPPHLVQVYFLPKGINIHSPDAQSQMLAVRFPDPTNPDENEDDSTYLGPTRAIVMDQGSRPGPALLPPDKCSTLLIDHHQSSEFPESISVLSACKSEPVATTSILAYLLCCELVPALKDDRETSMGALLGLYGDLGASKINLSDPSLPWPTWLAQWEKTLTKTKLSKATALLNAPRRTPAFNANIAWKALIGSKGDLKGVMEDDALIDAKDSTSKETTRWQGAAPKFSKDGSIAIIRIESGYQSESSDFKRGTNPTDHHRLVHPVIATRWQGTLRKAKTLVCIMVSFPWSSIDVQESLS